VDEIAIIGMSCIFPGAGTVGEYWQNILSKVDAISDPPEDWEAARFFDPASRTNDRIYCKKGGYLGELARFDPLEFGIMPSSVDGGEPDHLISLRVAKEALDDAGYREDMIDAERTEVIVGRGTYINRGVINTFQHGVAIDQTLEILKELHPEYTDDELQKIKKRLKESLPPFNAETVSSLVPNVLAGRIANRLNFMGANYLVDAACASSLVAVEHGMRDLQAGKCDLALVGGVNASIPPPILMIFCQINALSRKQKMSPFDESADGTMLGEGLGFVTLKRRSDAERDGNRIYAVLKSVGIASDGRKLGLLTPRLEGEALAIRRAYETAGISPSTIGLVEAHGTATTVGDLTEFQALKSVFGPSAPGRPTCAVGTVKSMIGHLIPASGMAGLIKTALALYHKVLPPTLNCSKPNPALELDGSPFYINTETRPWIHGTEGVPRRAGVNAFGFGGINAHAVLEEYTGAREVVAGHLHQKWDTEFLLFQGTTRDDLIKAMGRTADFVKANPEVNLKDLAYSLNKDWQMSESRLAIVAKSAEDLSKKIEYAAKALGDPSCSRIRDRQGIYFFEKPLGRDGKTAFLFPGEGSQYPTMLADLCIHFPEVRTAFDLLDRAFARHERGYLPSDTIFPPPLAGKNGKRDLWAMDSAAEAVFAANQALLALLSCLKIKPDVLLGHSTGEYNALLASGMIKIESSEGFIEFVLGVNRVYEKFAKEGGVAEGVLLSAGAVKREDIDALIARSSEPLYIAMDNCPNQVVLCGSDSAIKIVEKWLRKNGSLAERFPFGRAYHTPLFEAICGPLLDYFKGMDVHAPAIRTYSCVTAAPYPGDPAAIRELATSQWARRVRFTETIDAMYNDGVRVFVEVGPRGNLTAFVDDILQKRPHLAVPSNLHRKSGISQLNHLLGMLAAHHVPFDPALLYQYRSPVDLFSAVTGEGSVKRKKLRVAAKVELTLPRLGLKDADQLRRPASQTAEERRPGLSRPTAARDTARAVAPDARSLIMMNHLKTMEQFLQAQQEVFQTFLGSRGGNTLILPEKIGSEVRCSAREKRTGISAAGIDASSRKLPFVREIVSLEAGKEAVVLCRVTIDEDRFLLDHAIGGKVSETDPHLAALPVMPLTFSMEILAEGAAVLMPGKKLVGMREVRAYRWIGLDNAARVLKITAKTRAGAPGEVEVQVREAEDADVRSGRPRMPIIEGIMVFNDAYSAPPEAAPHVLKDSRPSKWSGAGLYDGFMFHGPSLQGVAAMELWGENGTTAVLKGMPTNGLFASRPAVAFLCDPIVLDAAGQVIAYWTSDHLRKAYHIFPFRLEALHLFGPALEVGESAECRARIELIEDTLVRSDIDIVGPDGRIRASMNGWWDRRFDLPDEFFSLRSSPAKGMMSREFPVPEGAGFSGLSCAILDMPTEFLTAHDMIWLRVLAHLVLSKKERAAWSGIKGTDQRVMEWLLGRVAAKDAVRLLLRKQGKIGICPADVEIGVDANGRPFVESIRGEKGIQPPLSISHTNGIAIAAAGGSGSGLGIDVELLRHLDTGFDDVAFTEEEKEILRGITPSGDHEWLLRFWCAKEAAAKALGKGLMGNPRNMTIRAVEQKTGTLRVDAAGKMMSHLPAGNGRQLDANTFREGDLIVAISTYQAR